MPPAKDIQGLVRALARLEPSERAHIMAEAARHALLRPKPAAPALRVLRGGTEWLGGDLRREDIYADGGR